MTSKVKAEITHSKGPAKCNGLMEAYMQNTSLFEVSCEVAGTMGGVVQYTSSKLAHFNPGERLKGESDGLFWCGFGPDDTYTFSCVLTSDDPSCKVDLVKQSQK